MFVEATGEEVDWRALAVPTGIDCVNAAQVYQPEAVVVAWTMGEHIAKAVTAALRQDPATEDVVVYALVDSEDDASSALMVGVDGVLRRGSAARLVRELAALLDG